MSQQQGISGFDLISPTTATKMARIQSWQRGARLTASEPHSPASSTATTRRHSASPISPPSGPFDVRVMPAPPVPTVQVHLAEPRPVLHHKHSHAASLHSWEQDVESQRLRADRDERSTVGGEGSWKERAWRASRALFGQTSQPPPWRPLNVEKSRQPTPQVQQQELDVNVHVRADSVMGHHKCECNCKRDPKRKRTRMWLCIIIILLILLAMVDVIFLNVRVLNPDFGILPTSTPTPTNLSRDGTVTFVAPSPANTASASKTNTGSTATSTAPSASATASVLQNCLTQFQLNAPSSPQSYPCDTCFSALSSASSDAGAGPATQYVQNILA